MEPETTATKRAWWEAMGGIVRTPFAHGVGGGFIVANCRVPGRSDSECQENARFIANAANHHVELVEMLRRICDEDSVPADAYVLLSRIEGS